MDHGAYLDLSRAVDSLLTNSAEFGVKLADGTSAQGAAVDENLGAFWTTQYQLAKRQKMRNFTVAVLALAKSGKSTFINSLVGAPILPVSNVPETARICSIRHTPRQQEPVLRDTSRGEVGETITGELAIQRHLANSNREVRTRQHRLSDEVLLQIDLAFPALAAHDGAQTDITFELLDTPGPNEEGEEALRFQVERLLDSVDAIVYLLDYTKLRTAEEAHLFSRIKAINPGLLHRLSRRCFFVVNKMDTLRLSEGLDEAETRRYVSELITVQLGGDFQLRPEQILLVSAHEALLSRLVLRETGGGRPASARSMGMFKERAFGFSRTVQKRKFTTAELAEAATDMCDESGMQEVESKIFAFLYQHAGALKLMAVVDDVARMLNQAHNSALVSEGSLLKDVSQLREEAAALQSQLEETLQRFDDVKAQTDTLEAEVVDEVRMRLWSLQERLINHMSTVIDGAMTVDHPPPPSGRWRAVFEKARAFLGHQAAGAGRAELQSVLSELHKDIFKELDAEVRAFWSDLELATNERQRALLRRLNLHLEGLSRAIEAVVSDRLDVRLEPVDLRLKPPSAAEFHHSLQTLFSEGITQRSTVKERSHDVQYTVWEKRFRNGICRTGEYYVGRPATRTVTEAYTENTFEFEPEKIKAYFADLIGTSIESSIRSVRAYVGQYLSSTLDTARTSITSYAERFTSSMLVGLNASEQGEKARLAALEHVQQHKAELAALVAESAALQAKAEALFPTAATSASRACSLEFNDQDLYTPDCDEQQSAGAAAAPADGAVPEAATNGDVSQAVGTASQLPGVPLTAEVLASIAQPETLLYDAAAEAGTPDGSLAGNSSLVAPPLSRSPGGTSWWVPLDAGDAAPPAATEPLAKAAATDASTTSGGDDGAAIEAAHNSSHPTVSHSVASLTSTQYADVLLSSPSLDGSWAAPPPTPAEAQDPFEASAADPVLAAVPLEAVPLQEAAASVEPAVGRGLHQLAVSAPVPAYNVPSAGATASNDSPRRFELATIQLSNSAPVSPAASQVSSGTDDWTVVDPEGRAPEASSEVDVAAERRRLSEY